MPVNVARFLFGEYSLYGEYGTFAGPLLTNDNEALVQIGGTEFTVIYAMLYQYILPRFWARI